jgi:hypothetical protein
MRQLLLPEHQATAVPDHQLDPVGALETEHDHRPGERFLAEHLGHRQCREALWPFAEIHWARRQQHAHPTGSRLRRRRSRCAQHLCQQRAIHADRDAAPRPSQSDIDDGSRCCFCHPLRRRSDGILVAGRRWHFGDDRHKARFLRRDCPLYLRAIQTAKPIRPQTIPPITTPQSMPRGARSSALRWLFWSSLRETAGFSIDSASIRTSIADRRTADATHLAANERDLISLDVGLWRAIRRQQTVIIQTQTCHNANSRKWAKRSSGLFLANTRTGPPAGAKPSPAHIPIEPAGRCPPTLGFRTGPSRPAPSGGDPRHPSGQATTPCCLALDAPRGLHRRRLPRATKGGLLWQAKRQHHVELIVGRRRPDALSARGRPCRRFDNEGCRRYWPRRLLARELSPVVA